jgi:hypothetical protein
MAAAKTIEFVIPLYNEEESFLNFHKSLESTPRPNGYAPRYIYVNDGSTDRTGELLSWPSRRRRRRFLPMRRLSRRQGSKWRAQNLNSFEMDVYPGVPSVLVVSQMDYPGWTAYVDGKPVPITRADYAFPAIFVGPGMHRVRFSFEPWTFKLGLTLTLLAVAVLVTVAALRRIRFRQRR